MDMGYGHLQEYELNKPTLERFLQDLGKWKVLKGLDAFEMGAEGQLSNTMPGHMMQTLNHFPYLCTADPGLMEVERKIREVVTRHEADQVV